MLQNLCTIDCQDPLDSWFINRKFSVVQCEIHKYSEEYRNLLNRSIDLAKKVNPVAANYSNSVRPEKRLVLDCFGGVLAEEGWKQFINSYFNKIAHSTQFTSAAHQIDIMLENGELAEVRSSFPRNGVKFALCSYRYNFKNIGPYSNSVKPGEIQKHFYLGVLFNTKKHLLLDSKEVVFTLVGGSTWQMMVTKGINVNLVPEGGISNTRSTYKVIHFRNALDALGVLDAIEKLGYKRNNPK